MAQDGKFGTFGGVFTPSVLTILGVIMYLRLPWVVGNAGLWAAFGVIAIAHVISVTTGLSISSIATDKSVGAGGPYYIISRSLGLPIGGTIGWALFIGLSFSISLYVIGFSESFLSYWELGTDINTIRITGTIVIVALTVITLISTSLAIKTQYIILGLIGLSLISIFFGTVEASPESASTTPLEGGAPLGTIFGIFFPAVTGFTAGVNMSGDLKDPKKSIPVGTMAAIGVGLVVYFGLAAFLAYRVPVDQLVNNPSVLIDIAAIQWMVVGGIWGATLSSALGSILGAPRILQAVAADKIAPTFFAKGAGKTNEPRRALVFAFVIGEAGILIAELDVIARIVSAVFLALYAFLNMSAAIESWASPDFRPEFRVWRGWSILGAATCLLVMIQTDPVAAFGAAVGMVSLLFVLQRRQLRLEAGDTWEGIWATMVRSGLHRLSEGGSQARNWRPNVLAFSHAGATTRSPVVGFGRSLARGRGILTDFELYEPGSEPDASEPDVAADEPFPVGMFHREVESEDDLATIRDVCRFHGFTGLEPNTVLMDWSWYSTANEQFSSLLIELGRLDLNVLLYVDDPQRGLGNKKRIDAWWRPLDGNLPLMVSLVNFILASDDWDRVDVRFMLFSEDVVDNDYLSTTARRYLKEARLDAHVKVINPTPDMKRYGDALKAESEEADLVLTGLPPGGSSHYLQRVHQLKEQLGTLVLLRASSGFPRVLRTHRREEPKTGPVEPLALPPLDVAENPDVAVVAEDYAERLEGVAQEFEDQAIVRLYGPDVQFVRDVKELVSHHFEMLEKGLSDKNPRRQRNAVNRVQSSLLKGAEKLLGEFERTEIDEQVSILEARLEAVLDRSRLVEEHGGLRIFRDREAFVARDDDSAWMRRFKRRRRRRAMFSRERPSYRVDLQRLQSYYYERFVEEYVRAGVLSFRAHSYQLIGEVSIALSSSDTSLALLRGGIEAEQANNFVELRRRRAEEELGGLEETHEKRLHETQRRLALKARELAQEFADDLDRLDIVRLVAKQRRPKGTAASTSAELQEIPKGWTEHRHSLVNQARLGLRLSNFQHRLASIATRLRDSVVLEQKNGILDTIEALRASLEACRNELDGSDATSTGEQTTPPTKGDTLPALGGDLKKPVAPPLFGPKDEAADAVDESQAAASIKDRLKLKAGLDFKRRLEVRQLVEGLQREVPPLLDELPETTKVLNDDGIIALNEGRDDEVTLLQLPVRRLVDYEVRETFLGTVQTALNTAPMIEERAASVGQDVVRLFNFARSEFDAMGEQGELDLDYENHMRPVIDSSMERVDEVLEELRGLGPLLADAIELNLNKLIEKTSVHELARSASRVQANIRLAHSRDAVTGARAFVARTRERARDAAVRMVYRRSAGQLLAQRLAKGSAEGGLVDRVLEVVSAASPRAEVVKELPFYYRQLFMGQSTIDETFWVGRKDAEDRARAALAHHRRGNRGALVVTGDRGAGKTALVQRLTAGALARRKVFRVHPRRGGSCDVTAFSAALEAAFESKGTPDDLLNALPDDTVVVLRDLEMWWERSPDGLRVIDRVLQLVDQHGERLLFIIEIGRQALSFIERFRTLSDRALAVIECGPVPAEIIEKLVLARHGSAGLEFEYRGRPEDELGALGRARMFSAFFDYAHGNMGAALRAWLAAIEKVEDRKILMGAPPSVDVEVFDELREELLAVVLQLLLHRQLNRARLVRVSGMGGADVDRVVATLTRMGLIIDVGQGALELNRGVVHHVVFQLRKRGLAA